MSCSDGVVAERDSNSWALDLPPDWATDGGTVTYAIADVAGDVHPLSDFLPGERCLLVVPGSDVGGEVSFEEVEVVHGA